MLKEAKLRCIVPRNQSPHFSRRFAMGCKHLGLAERHYIQVGRKVGKSFSQIASELDRSPCTVSREVKRSTGLRGYRRQQADNMARMRCQPRFQMSPLHRFEKLANNLIVVVLPAPLGPTSPKTSPSPTVRSRPLTAIMLPKRFTSPRATRSGTQTPMPQS